MDRCDGVRRGTAGASPGELPELARWRERTLASDAVPAADRGIALLWPLAELRVTHGDHIATMRADDLALVDFASSVTLAGAPGWTARMLPLDRRVVVPPIDGRNVNAVTLLAGQDPLAGLIRRQWDVGSDLHRLGLADEMVAARLLALIADLAGSLAARNGDGAYSAHTSSLLARAELLIAANLADPAFSPAALAAAMRLSPRHLSSLFAAAGTTATRAILAQRLALARRLLASPAERGRQIASIARAAGFEDQSYFSRVFGKNVGVTPAQFRKTAAGRPSDERIG